MYHSPSACSFISLLLRPGYSSICTVCILKYVHLVRQEETRLPRRIMNGRLTARGPKEVGRPPKQWEDSLQENLRALGAVPRKGAQRKWFVYDVEVNDAYDWVTAAKNMGKWHLGVEKGAQELEDCLLYTSPSPTRPY